MYSPSLFPTLLVVALGLFGMFSACMCRSAERIYWPICFVLCLLLVSYVAILCPAWCGCHLIVSTIMLAGMLMVALADSGQISDTSDASIYR